MAKALSSGVEGIGTADCFPDNPKYFTQDCFTQMFTLPACLPDIEQLSSVSLEAEVISTRLVPTQEGLSVEGKFNSGSKLIAELEIRQKIKFVADEPTQSVHAAQFEPMLRSVFIIVPPRICGRELCDLLRQNKLEVVPYIEDIYAQLMDKRSFFVNVLIFVNASPLM